MKHTLLLWALILNASLKPSENHSPATDGGAEVKDYEVVRPVRLHTVRKRHAEHLRPQTIKYAMTVGGKDIEMHLEKNNELLTKDYTETYYKEDGTQVTTTPDDIDHCYYHGRIVNDNESSVSISACDGLRGYFRTAEQRYLIEPLSGDDEGDHAVMKYGNQNSTPRVCGVTNTSWSLDFEPPTSRSRSGSGGIFYKPKYLELFLVVDNRAYKKMKQDMTAVRKRMYEIVNFVNMVYKPLRTFIALVGLEIWSNSDLISVTPPARDNLDAFMEWRNTELVKKKKHDNAHLISGIDFEGATVGLAFIGSLCSGHSVGVVQDHNDQTIAVGATLAHEMGHNLGMDHDDSSGCICSGDSCIMAAALSWKIPRSFSSCSSSNYEKYLTSRTPSCLLDKPDYRGLVAPSVCGNGFVEKGEHCDCGTLEECIDPCCNATTCTLKEGSQCAEGECCENCKFLPRSRECREKQHDCDLAEYCDGKSNTCPEDVFAVDGLPCEGGVGYCYNGQCPQRSNQCIKIFGETAIEAHTSCYQQNREGTKFGYCRRLSRDQFVACQTQDLTCGKLFCHYGRSVPNAETVRRGDCKASFFSDSTSDYGQVDTGTKCGDGKVCNQNKCVNLVVAYRNTNCSAKCSGHAVCNHMNKCQCEPGWMPPNCNSQDEAFSSLSPGAAAAIAVTVIVLLFVIAGVAWFFYKKQQSPSLPIAHTQRKPQVVSATNSAYQPNKRVVPSQPMPASQAQSPKPKGPPPPPPPAGNRPKPQSQNFTAARKGLRPVPPPKVNV